MLFCLLTFPVFAKSTILIIGDSLSAGYGVDVSQAWVALLQNRLKDEKYDYQVINASVSGNTTSNGLALLPKALDEYHPYITIIELGGNDGLRGLQVSVIKRNLQKMIILSKQAKSKVLLISLRLPPNYGEAYIQQFQKMFADIAKENNVYMVPLFLKGIDENPALMSADGIHPTQQAQVMMLNNVWPELKKLLT